MKYAITYGIDGGYNDIREGVVEANDAGEALGIAIDMAREIYDTYGIFDSTLNEIEDDNLDAEEISRLEDEDFESWADYSVEEFDAEKHKDWEEI